MNIKDLFKQAENGTLTYEQFEALTKEHKAKFVDLAEGNYVDKQKYNDDLSARDTRITTLDNTLKDRNTDLANLQQQLSVAGTDAAKLTELTNNFTELQKKYDSETKAYAKQLKDQEYKFAVTEFANKQNFSSQAAKRDFISSMLAKKLQVENGVILGATDFMNAYSQENADAFKVEQEQQDKKPHFAGPTKPDSDNSTGEKSLFNFQFTGVRPHN